MFSKDSFQDEKTHTKEKIKIKRMELTKCGLIRIIKFSISNVTLKIHVSNTYHIDFIILHLLNFHM